jgi:hypothetical protein
LPEIHDRNVIGYVLDYTHVLRNQISPVMCSNWRRLNHFSNSKHDRLPCQSRQASLS